jgi:Ser/Thr protein kinase RdoA (MazF antagonist)
MASISKYRTETICEALSDAYDLKNATISETKKGGDNTVLLVTSAVQAFPPYILKILETKSIKDIEAANSIIQTVVTREFVEQRLITTKFQEISTTINGKHATLYNYVDGVHIEDFDIKNTKKIAAFMRGFHNLSESCPSAAKELLEKELSLLRLYFSDEVREQVDIGRSGLYEAFFLHLGIISDKLSNGKLSKGLSHNDFSPDNLLLEMPNGDYNLIDWDNASLDDFQVLDFIHFAVKSRIILEENLIRIFMEEYALDIPLDILYAWSLLFAVKALLSTDYYTYTIQKISPSWIEKNGQNTLDTLFLVSTRLFPLVIHGK